MKIKLKKLMDQKGCTFAPDLNFSECCAIHDAAYEIGGDESDRMAADVVFMKCIQSKAPSKLATPFWIFISWVYYIGVRIGRHIGFGKSFNYKS